MRDTNPTEVVLRELEGWLCRKDKPEDSARASVAALRKAGYDLDHPAVRHASGKWVPVFVRQETE